MDTLGDLFRDDTVDQLRSACAACEIIGADATAAILRRHLPAFSPAIEEPGARRLLARMQTELALAVDEMDELIARYAFDCIPAG